MAYLKPVCFPCQRFFRPAKNGFYFVEGMPGVPGYVEPGTTEPEKWKPYKLWSGDLWSCSGCNASIIIGVTSPTPIAEHFQPDFAEVAERLQANYQVNDC